MWNAGYAIVHPMYLFGSTAKKTDHENVKNFQANSTATDFHVRIPHANHANRRGQLPNATPPIKGALSQPFRDRFLEANGGIVGGYRVPLRFPCIGVKKMHVSEKWLEKVPNLIHPQASVGANC